MANIRVPEYIATQGVPGSAPLEQASGSAFAAPAAVFAKEMQQTEAALLLAQRHVQYIEAEKERHRQAGEVQKGLTKATEWFEQAEDQLQRGYADPTTGERYGPVGSDLYVPTLKKKFDEYTRETLKSTSPELQQALDTGLSRLWQSRVIQASHYANTLHIKEQEADDIVQVVANAKLAGRADDAIERDRIISTTKGLIDLKYPDRPKYAEMLKKRIDTEFNTAYMQNKMEKDPVGFLIAYDKGEFENVPYDTRTHIFNQFNTNRNRQVQAHKEIDAKNYAIWEDRFYADLNHGVDLTEEMDRIKRGDHPYAKAKDWHTIENIKKNLPDGRGTKEVNALRYSYLANLTNIPTLQYIQHYRDQAIKLSQELGVQSKEMVTFLEELKRDMTTATSADQRKINQNLKVFDEGIRAIEQTMPMFPMIDRDLRQKLENARGEGRSRILGEADPKEVLNDMKAKYSDILKERSTSPSGKFDRLRQGVPGR